MDDPLGSFCHSCLDIIQLVCSGVPVNFRLGTPLDIILYIPLSRPGLLNKLNLKRKKYCGRKNTIAEKFLVRVYISYL